MDALCARQPRVLMMDADPVRSARRCAQLSCRGWYLAEVADELSALQAVRNLDIDLVILHLPVGKAVAMDLPDVMRNISEKAYLMVVVLALEPGEDDCCKFLESGADDILPDSIGPAELVARLGALLRIKELQDALDASRIALQQALRRERELVHTVQAHNDELAALVVTDPLTHLYNVRYFGRFIRDEFKIAKRYGHPICLLMLDLDHFKQVNDTHGHPAGDYVLKEFSVILRQIVRESDVVARTGGEEFAIVLPHADRTQAERFAQRIRSTLAGRQFTVNGHEIRVTVSIGLAGYPKDADVESPEHLIHFADQALLTAKQSGRNCVVHWFEMAPGAKARLRSEFSTDRQGAFHTPIDPAADEPSEATLAG